MWRARAAGLLQHRVDVGAGLGVSLRDPTPVPPRSGQRGSAPAAQHGPEQGRRVPPGAERHQREPQCGETSACIAWFCFCIYTAVIRFDVCVTNLRTES